MKKYSEQKALKKMGVSDFSQITKEKMGQFVSLLPNMDPEVAKKALEQFPNFKELGAEVVASFKLSIDNTLAANESSQQEVYRGYQMILECLKTELEQDSISSEERREIEEKMVFVANMISEKDSENKRFLEKLVLMGGKVAIAVLGLAGVAIGAYLKDGASNQNDRPIKDN